MNLLDRMFLPVLSVGEKASEGGSVLEFNMSTLFRIGIQWINIIILTVVLIRILYNPVKRFMAERAERIKNDIDSARMNNAEALKIKADYERSIANINDEREEILEEARRAAVREHDKILFIAREEAVEIKRRASEEIEIARKYAADEIKKQIIEISADMAERFVKVSIDKETQDKYIADALADWSERTWQA